MKHKNWTLLMVVTVTSVAAVTVRRGCSSKPTGSRAAGAGQTQAEQAKSFIPMASAPTEFHEAPMLAEQVKAGKLPPVRQRISEEPLVVPVVERIGTYGGTWHRAFTGPSDFQTIDRLEHDFILYYDLDGKTIVPHIAKSWEISEDGRVFTFHLRPGMKWSDGEPFTSEDFVFAYEDIDMDPRINVRKPPYLRIRQERGGFENAYGRVEAVDPLTVRFVFPEPKFIIDELAAGHGISGQCSRGWDAVPYAPKHYLKQFLPRYTPEDKLNEMAAEAGFKSWVLLFQQKAKLPENPELPTVGPWRTVTPITGQLFTLERNPYYWAVDPKGNQLPYIDRLEMRLVQDLEVLTMRAMAGEIDMQERHIQLAKYPAFKEAAQKGNYRCDLRVMRRRRS
jgi:peptide/nickel transport system substrate-binding protein